MRNFLDLLLFIWNTGFTCIMLLPFTKLTFNEWLSASIIIAYFYTKSIIDKQDLENKLFELKQLIENQE